MKYYGETPLNNEYTHNNGRQECKIVSVTGWVLGGEGKVNGEGEGG
jgi:hypothetical protein